MAPFSIPTISTIVRAGGRAEIYEVGQFRQPVFGRLGGYDDENDADLVSLDPSHAVDRWRPFEGRAP